MDLYRDLYNKIEAHQYPITIYFFSIIMVGSIESIKAFAESTPNDIL